MNWTPKNTPDRETVNQLQETLKIPKLNAQLLVQRGLYTFETAKTFFRPNPDQLYDPYQMAGMDRAISRIEKALQEEEKILIYGDYDVDGTTAVALVYTYFSQDSTNLEYYIPDRYSEGYGISTQGIDYAAAQGISLIVALDCGVKAVSEVEYARALGIDFIICDHHKPGEILPQAYALLNPKQAHCTYPEKELCGCGIGFKLIQAYHQKQRRNWDEIKPLLALVATATAADIVPLIGENRTLTALGMLELQNTKLSGLRNLLGERKKPYRISDLVFGVAPRINAAGRMEHAKVAVELLTSTDESHSHGIAQAIEQFNEDRRTVEQNITAEALEQVKNSEDKDRKSTVVYNKKWHKGVIGIVASRLIETYYRPTIVCCLSGDTIVASVRSVRGFDVYQALHTCSEHLLQFGGHKYAAGLSLAPENFTAFKEAFETAVCSQILPEQQSPQLYYDLEVSFAEINPKVYRIIQQMRPFGPGNMRPVFFTSNCTDGGFSRIVGKDKNHLKLDVIDPSGHRFSGIGFGLAPQWEALKESSFEILYCLEENTFNDQTTLELQIKDIRANQ